MKQLKWTRKKTVTGIFTMVSIIIVMCCTACNSNKETQEQGTQESTPVKEEVKKETPEKSLKDFINIEDIYVKVNSKNVDLEKVVEVKEKQKDIVDKVEVDASKVDYTKTGTYDVFYTVTLKADVTGTESLEDKAGTDKADENKTDEDDKSKENKTDAKTAEGKEDSDSKATEDKNDTDTKDETQEVITGNGKVEVVTEERAKELAQEGKTVLINDNQMLAKEDGKEKEDKKEEKKEEKETAKKEEKEEANTQASSNNNPTTESNSHTHNWVAQYRTVDDYQTVTDYQDQPVYEEQPIYETRPVYTTEYHMICNCGADLGIGYDREAHIAATGCWAGYSIKGVKVQTGTETVQVGTQSVQVGTQKVAVGSHQEKVGSHQEVSGYVCSGCGATQ